MYCKNIFGANEGIQQENWRSCKLSAAHKALISVVYGTCDFRHTIGSGVSRSVLMALRSSRTRNKFTQLGYDVASWTYVRQRSSFWNLQSRLYSLLIDSELDGISSWFGSEVIHSRFQSLEK